MALNLGKHTAVLADVVSVEEAEPLAQWLRETPSPAVDLAGCTHLHTAALQALLAADATMTAAPTDDFLAKWVAPLFLPEAAAAGGGGMNDGEP
jgi:hypothetical protein